MEKATSRLKEDGCSPVFLLGSLVTGDIHQNSDTNTSTMGLLPKKFFKVFASLDKELSSKIDLINFDLNKDFYELLTSLSEVVEVG